MAKRTTGCRLLLAAAAIATSGPAISQEAPPSVQPPAQAPPEPARPPAAEPPQPTAQPQQPPAQPQPQQPPAQPQPQPQPQPPALPPIPPAPISTLADYPSCRDEHLTIAGRVNKANKVLSCIQRLADYDRDLLQIFARRMNAYRESLRALWDQVNNGPNDTHQINEFYARILVEFENSAPEGSYLDQYRLVHGRYLADRTYLDNEYCHLVICQSPAQ